ncbi:MAG: hypothetical protein V7776_05110 [Halopseudomonas aestusnigri]
MNQTGNCQLCNEGMTENKFYNNGTIGGDYLRQTCKYCGEFHIHVPSLDTLKTHHLTGLTEKKVAILRGWISDENRRGSEAKIDKDNIKSIFSRSFPTVLERAEKILLEALKGNSELGVNSYKDDPRLVSASYSTNQRELDYLLELLKSEQMASFSVATGNEFSIEPAGHARYEELTRGSNDNSSKAFVAMWFNKEMDVPYTYGIKVGIERAGYEPTKVNEGEYVHKICDEIIASINSAKFVVADFTDHRGGVYYEAGYAMGRGLHVIWTCRSDYIDDLHFDIQQYNCIVWDKDKPEELAIALNKRIRAVCNPGPHAE